MDKVNQYSIWEFNPKELAQIKDLVERWEGGQSRPVDRRRYTKKVLNYATRVDLVRAVCRHGVFAESRNDLPELHGTCPKCTRRKNWRLGFCNGQMFNLEYELPVAVLWAFVEPMLYHTTGEARGYTLSQQKGWRVLGVWEVGHRWHTGKQMEFIYSVLYKLARHQYIIFQHAGSVWQITVLIGANT